MQKEEVRSHLSTTPVVALTHIERRNGQVIPFDKTRIERAIEKACVATGAGTEFIPQLVEGVVGELQETLSKRESKIVTVEQVQDAVERALMAAGKFEIAKAYILYRVNRAKEREIKHQEFIEQIKQRGIQVRKANGATQEFDFEKIERVFERVSKGFETHCSFDEFIDAFKKNIVDDLKTKDINRLMIKTAIDLVSVENAHWQNIAARLLLENLYKQAAKTRNLTISEIYTPEAYLSLFEAYVEEGLYYKKFFDYYTKEDILEAGRHLRKDIDDNYTYTTVLSLNKRYLLNPNGVVRETPQEMYMSVGLFLAIPEKKENRLAFALKVYEACATQMISLPTPTLLNSRTNYHQLSSCFKINVNDDLRAIYHAVEDIAQISKMGGGVGVYLGNVRAKGGMIRGVKGVSGGVTPWIKVINDTAIAVNQLGARAGAVSVTLDMWHRDIADYLELQTESGDIRRKAFDVFPAISVPDLFMRRVKEDAQWTLFDPSEIERVHGKKLQDLFGAEFEAFYEILEQDERLELKMSVSAKDLMKHALRTVVETGMPYFFFRDTVNRLNPNKHAGNVYSTQLCTEICQNTSASVFKKEELCEDGSIRLEYQAGDTVVCNLASINVAKVNDEETIARVFPVLTRLLDNVIELSLYPIGASARTSKRYRPIGIGYLGLAEYLAVRHIRYTSEEARAEVRTLFERYGYHTYRASVDLAKERGHYDLFEGSEYSKGVLLGRTREWYENNTGRTKDWGTLFDDMATYGVRFGYHTAPAPNSSTAGLVGTTAALLPIYKRFFVENNASSQTIRVAPNLTQENYPYYQEYIALEMSDVIDLIAEVYEWVDQSISFEWMIDPARTTPKDLYGYYFRAWEKGIKTVYYVRSLSLQVDEARVSTQEKNEGDQRTLATTSTTLPLPQHTPQEKKPTSEKGEVFVSSNICESCSG